MKQLETFTVPRLVFYIAKTYKIPMTIMSRETYDELNSYEPMMYRPSDWESFNNNQQKSFDNFVKQLSTHGYILQAQKIPVMSTEDYMIKKAKIESESDFVKWLC